MCKPGYSGDGLMCVSVGKFSSYVGLNALICYFIFLKMNVTTPPVVQMPHARKDSVCVRKVSLEME